MYLSNDLLEKQLAEDDQEGLVESFYLLARNILVTWDTLKHDDDVLQEAVILCWERRERFNPELDTKAFNFFSTVIFNSFKQALRNKRYRPRSFSDIDCGDLPIESWAKQKPKAFGKGMEAETPTYYYEGHSLTIKQLSIQTGVSSALLQTRIVQQRWSITSAVSPKKLTLYEYNGERRSLAEIARLTEIPESTLRGRVKRGYPIHLAASMPPKHPAKPPEKRIYKWKNDMFTLTELSKISGLSPNALKKRLRKMTVEEAMQTRKYYRKTHYEGRTIAQLSREVKASYTTVQYRVLKGWTVEEIKLGVRRLGKKYKAFGGSYTVRELVEKTGVSETSIRRWITKGKDLDECFAGRKALSEGFAIIE